MAVVRYIKETESRGVGGGGVGLDILISSLSSTQRHLTVGINLFGAWLIILCRIQLQMMPGGEWEVRDGKNNGDWPDTNLRSQLFSVAQSNIVFQNVTMQL